MFQLDTGIYDKQKTLSDYMRQNQQDVLKQRMGESKMRGDKQTMQMNDEKIKAAKIEKAVKYLSMATPENWGMIRSQAIAEGLGDEQTIPQAFDQAWIDKTIDAFSGMTPYQRESLKIRKLSAGLGGDYVDPDSGEIIINPKQQDKINKETEKYSKTMESTGLSELIGAAERANNAVAGEGEIAGYGGFVGGMPDWAVSQGGVDTRQEISNLQNAILKARSGGAVTPAEAERFMTELGAGFGRDDKNLRQGVKNVTRSLNDKIANAQAGYSKESVKQYEDRGGVARDRLAKYDTGGGQGGIVKPTQAAIEHLLANPRLAPEFEKKYGISAKTYLGL